MGLGTITLISLLLAGLAAGATGIEQYSSTQNTNARNNVMREWLKQNYPQLSPTQIDALVSQYGDSMGSPWDVTKWGDQSNWDDLKTEMDRIIAAYDELGAMPEMPSEEDLARIQQEAYDEINLENDRLLELYNNTFQDTSSMLQRQMDDNSAMFADYRNQLLTNDAMNQQAIAGSTRFELDRQQRNAIVRGASAAQRLVSNINTQLGLQAQSAQQSLNTSNALAQQLLAHRQAQAGIRQDYMNARKQYNQQTSNVLGNQVERRYNYGQARKQGAVDDYNYAYDRWNTNVNTHFQGDSLGQGIYNSLYGRNKTGRNNGSTI